MVFDYSALPREYKRTFVPRGIRFDWDDLSKVFNKLTSRDLSSSKELEKWMLDQAEFEAYIHEQKAIRYINNTRQTENPKFARAYKEYVEKLEPKIKFASFKLLVKYSNSPYRNRLPRVTHGLEDKRRQAAKRVFTIENIELEKRDSTLAQNYQRMSGAMTVRYRGQELTLQQMAKFLEATDRGIREEAWRLADSRYLKDANALDEVYDRMVKLRGDVARNAGFDNYEDFIFLKKYRFDYTPDDCVTFYKAVEESIVPLSRDIDRLRQERLKIDILRPWDLSVDPEGRPPLSPFKDIAELIRGAGKVVGQIDSQLSTYFARMAQLGLLDLDSRKGKAPGGYQEMLTEARLPFIFMNAAKRDKDVRTLLHESGHSFHSFLMRDSGLPYFNANPNLPLEFAEVASMSMEVISGAHYEGTFYSGEDGRRSNWEEAVANVKLFAWVATIDAFQHWVYHHPDHTREERSRAWLKTLDRFCGGESYEGLEASRRYRWQRQLHLFEVPFYYIEYGIALTGALGIWAHYRKDMKDAIQGYKNALSLGASRPLPDLFEAAGLEWGFGSRAINRFASELSSAIREYS